MTMPANVAMGFDHILAGPGMRGILGASQGANTTSGTVSSSKHGDGTFSEVMEKINGKKVSDTTITYADGTTRDIERTVSVNADAAKQSPEPTRTEKRPPQRSRNHMMRTAIW